MKKETILGAIAALCIAFASPVCVYADAAPTITILKGNPSSPTDPPYTFTFRVSDSEGITSIKVNGRELGANGADEYDIDWSTSYNGTFTLTATNTNGGTSSKNLELTNIRSGAAAGASRPAEIRSNSGTDSCCHNRSCNPGTANCSCDPGGPSNDSCSSNDPGCANPGTNRDTDRAGKYCSGDRIEHGRIYGTGK